MQCFLRKFWPVIYFLIFLIFDLNPAFSHIQIDHKSEPNYDRWKMEVENLYFVGRDYNVSHPTTVSYEFGAGRSMFSFGRAVSDEQSSFNSLLDYLIKVQLASHAVIPDDPAAIDAAIFVVDFLKTQIPQFKRRYFLKNVEVMMKPYDSRLPVYGVTILPPGDIYLIMTFYSLVRGEGELNVKTKIYTGNNVKVDFKNSMDPNNFRIYHSTFPFAFQYFRKKDGTFGEKTTVQGWKFNYDTKQLEPMVWVWPKFGIHGADLTDSIFRVTGGGSNSDFFEPRATNVLAKFSYDYRVDLLWARIKIANLVHSVRDWRIFFRNSPATKTINCEKLFI